MQITGVPRKNERSNKLRLNTIGSFNPIIFASVLFEASMREKIIYSLEYVDKIVFNRIFCCWKWVIQVSHSSVVLLKLKYKNNITSIEISYELYVIPMHLISGYLHFLIQYDGQHWTERNAPIAELLTKNELLRCILCLILTLMKLWFCAIEILFWAVLKVSSRKSSISWKLQINLNSLSACRQRAENTIKS